MAKVQSARRVVKRTVSTRVRNRRTDLVPESCSFDQRRDHRKATREKLTIFISGFCNGNRCWHRGLVFLWPDDRDAKAYGPAQQGAAAATNQSENSDKALIQAQRAWIGPSGAKFDIAPSIGKDIEAYCVSPPRAPPRVSLTGSRLALPISVPSGSVTAMNWPPWLPSLRA